METIIEQLAKTYVVVSLIIYAIILSSWVLVLIFKVRTWKRSADNYKKLFERENNYKKAVQEKFDKYRRTPKAPKSKIKKPLK